jgi:hypothetical protein
MIGNGQAAAEVDCRRHSINATDSLQRASKYQQ